MFSRFQSNIYKNIFGKIPQAKTVKDLKFHQNKFVSSYFLIPYFIVWVWSVYYILKMYSDLPWH